MNSRKLTMLSAIAAILALGEFGSAVMIGLGEAGKSHSGWPFAAVFGALFIVAAWLLRRGRATAGAVFAGVLCLFEILEYPSWSKSGTLTWTYDTAFAVASLVGLVSAITVLAGRLRHRAAA
jgi:hypothetical protein